MGTSSDTAVCTSDRVGDLARFALGKIWGNQLIWFDSGPWAWIGGEWRKLEPQQLENELWRGLEGVKYALGDGVTASLDPTRGKIADISRALQAFCERQGQIRPMNLFDPSREEPDPEWSVSFRDVVLDVRTMETYKRDSWWFDPVTVPVDWTGSKACPLWLQCLEQWSGGQADWIEALQTIMGYCLVTNRSPQRWFLMYGKVRGGKGTIANVLGKILGRGIQSVKVGQMAGRFGLWGSEQARVLSVTEVGDGIRGHESELAVSILKSIVGQDPLMIDRKIVAPLHNQVSGCVPILFSNSIPKLPDKVGGLSSKMICLNFDHSWLNKEDMTLTKKLHGELCGIVHWAIEGTRRVLELGTKAFVSPKSAEEAIGLFKEEANPIKEWIREVFEHSPSSFMHSATLQKIWAKTAPSRISVTPNWLIRRIIEESPWAGVKSVKGSKGYRQVVGLRLKTEYSLMLAEKRAPEAEELEPGSWDHEGGLGDDRPLVDIPRG